MVNRTSINHTPLDVTSIEFLTHFSSSGYEFFKSEHLEKLAIACPNLQQLNLMGNVDSLKKLATRFTNDFSSLSKATRSRHPSNSG